MVINLLIQRDLRLPSTAFTTTPYGLPIGGPSISARITVGDLCTQTIVTNNVAVTLTRIGSTLITVGREWYSLPFSSLGSEPTGAPAGIGPMIPGHQYVATISSPTGAFSTVNVGPFGVTDNRAAGIATWDKYMTDVNPAETTFVWVKDDWRVKRTYASDAKFASAVTRVNDSNVEYAEPDTFEYQDGDPSKIHYCNYVVGTPALAYDAQRIFTHGASCADGTPICDLDIDTYAKIIAPVTNYYNLANGSQIQICGDGTMQLLSHYLHPANSATTMMGWVFTPPLHHSPLSRAFMSSEESVGVEFSYPIGGGYSDGYTCLGDYGITQDTSGYEILPYRHVWIDGSMWKEYGVMNAPADWYATDDASVQFYEIARRRVYTADGAEPLTCVFNFWNPTTINYGPLEIL